jgi:hypothetical protein
MRPARICVGFVCWDILQIHKTVGIWTCVLPVNSPKSNHAFPASLAASRARILSTLVTFSEKCWVLSVLYKRVNVKIVCPRERKGVCVCGRESERGHGYCMCDLPCPGPDVGLHSQDAVLMDKSVRLANQAHDGIPSPFCSRCVR